jgi:hypothetical protein
VAGSSALYYNGTRTEVRLGDVVRVKRFFRRPLNGVVCYIPGASPRHPELEHDDVRQWAIRGEDGTVYPILYAPQEFQPPARIRFVGRGSSGALHSAEALK